nr:immunoglobulin heavy chain junction region [Mus musculus]
CARDYGSTYSYYFDYW